MAGMKQLEEMRIRPSTNGGHTITHEFKREATHSAKMGMMMDRPASEEHTFGPGDGAQVIAHIGKALGLPTPGAED